MKELLNEQQWNSLVLTLQTFEKNLRQADKWLSTGFESGTLYRSRMVISDKQRKRVRKQISDALEQIKDIVNRLELQPVQINLNSVIRSQMTASWANLQDNQSEKLKRFGDIDSRISDVLDASIDSLAQKALSLAWEFNGEESGTVERLAR